MTGLVFSFMSGTMHPYYTVALAPGIAALVGVGSTALWARRESLAARGGLALMVAATAAWSFVLLAGSAESFAWLRWVVVGLAVPAVVGLLVGAGRLRRAALVGVVAALLTGLVGRRVRRRDGVGGAHGQHPDGRHDEQRDGRRPGRRAVG